MQRHVRARQVSASKSVRCKYDLRNFTGGTCRHCGLQQPFNPKEWDKFPTTIPEHRNQIVIGRLLWIFRQCRPDLGHAISALGGRISCWSEECDEELECLVGYLKETAAERLEFAWPVAAQGQQDPGAIVAELHTDADHRGGDKSQSSFVAWIRHRDYEQGGMCAHWMSKKQTVTADAVSAAEIVAAHLAFKEGMWPLMSLLIAVKQDPHSVVFRADNTVCLNHIPTGRLIPCISC